MSSPIQSSRNQLYLYLPTLRVSVRRRASALVPPTRRGPTPGVKSTPTHAPGQAHPLNDIVLMLKPRVGLIVVMSSPFKRLTIVVFPALSKPTMRTRISFSFCFTFLIMVRSPMVVVSQTQNRSLWDAEDRRAVQIGQRFQYFVTTVCKFIGEMEMTKANLH